MLDCVRKRGRFVQQGWRIFPKLYMFILKVEDADSQISRPSRHMGSAAIGIFGITSGFGCILSYKINILFIIFGHPSWLFQEKHFFSLHTEKCFFVVFCWNLNSGKRVWTKNIESKLVLEISKWIRPHFLICANLIHINRLPRLYRHW